MGNNMIKKTGASSLHEYGAAAMLYEVLTPELEAELVERYKTTGCVNAFNQIVHAHLRYVMTIARQLAGPREDREDLIQEGMIGMMIALQKFEANKGFRFAVYATHWIKSHIRQYMLDTHRIYRIATTKAQRKCFYNLRMYVKEGWVFNQREVAAIAAELGVPEADVREMEKKLVGSDLSIHPEDGEDSSKFNLLNTLYDEDCDPALLAEQDDWDVKMPMKLQEAFGTLDDRSRHILDGRWIAKDKKTLHELGALFNISHARVGQLEVKALKVVKETMQQFAA